MDRETLIRERAYALWESEGRPEGQEQDYWYRAERELADSESGFDDEVPDDRVGEVPTGLPVH